MRTETDPTENEKPWRPFGDKVEPKKAPDAPEWQPSPDAPGVEINWKTGMRRTNMRTPNAWVEDLAMQAKDEIKQEAAMYRRPGCVMKPLWNSSAIEAKWKKIIDDYQKHVEDVIGFPNFLR